MMSRFSIRLHQDYTAAATSGTTSGTRQFGKPKAVPDVNRKATPISGGSTALVAVGGAVAALFVFEAFGRFFG